MSEERKQAMLDLTDVGVKQFAIALHYAILQFTVSYTFRTPNERNTNENKDKRGSKQKLTPGCIRSLRKCARENRFESLCVVNAKYGEFKDKVVNKDTVWRLLKSMEYKIM